MTMKVFREESSILSSYNEAYLFCRWEIYLAVDNNELLQSKLKQNFPLHILSSFFFKLIPNVTFSYWSTSSSSAFPNRYYVSFSDFPVLGECRL